MVICPKPLVSERKWEIEMKQRFDEDFIPLTGADLRQIISDTNRDGEWPTRFSKVIVPYSIFDSRVYEGDENGRVSLPGLKDLDPAPHFDLVIVDEAHHIRNGSMDKDKAWREVRNSIRQAFGKKHYESYIKVIRELNSDPQRFIRELLQNADDCHYVDGVVPCFALSIKGGTLVTEY